MKVWILLILAALLLTGCTGTDQPDVTAVDTTVAVPSGVYMPNSQAEQETGGAVRSYDITGQRVYAVDSGVAVVDESGKITVIDPEAGVIQTGCSGITDLRGVRGNSVFYYDTAVHEYNLKSAARTTWQLPEECVGDFAVGTQTREIYYCTEGCIYALHMDTNIARLIKQHSSAQQSILGAYFGGKIIAWETENGVQYLSTENGMTLAQDQQIHTLYSSSDAYVALRWDGIVEQKIYGQLETTPRQLNIDAQVLAPFFAQQGVVGVNAGQGLELCFYDLNTGLKSASAKITQETNCLDLMADSQFVWVLTENALYRWDMTKSPVEDTVNYSSVVWSADSPDAVGMAQYAERIAQIENTYGIGLLVGKEAVENAATVQLTAEYQVQAVGVMLDTLEPCLELLPQDFLKSTVQNGKLYICLVRDVGIDAGYARYWHNADCYIALALGADMPAAFLSGVGGAVDSDILGNSRDLEYWNDLNPKGFTYTYGEAVPEEYTQYIPDYFTDEIAMTYPSEDRARIFYHAMMEGNEELFGAKTMQKKLKLLCEGIREAYGLKKHTEAFPWEQYLEESLAYTE